MANEFVHATVGTSLTQLEFEAVGLHVLNSQATGDLIYASSSSQLSRLAIGATNKVLTVIGGVPTWQSTLAGLTLTAPTINGTMATTGLTLPAVTLGGAVATNAQVFNAGTVSAQINTTGSQRGLVIQSTQDDGIGALLRFEHVSASPAANDWVGIVYYTGRNSVAASKNYGYTGCQIVSPTSTSEDAKFVWYLYNAGVADNLAMTLSGAGVLAVDLSGSGSAAQVNLFDDYDDAIVIKQGIQENNRELLADMGVLDRKDTGSGYMMKIQPMVRLLAGGIYQTRALIDSMQTKIEQLENKLMLLGAG